MPPSITPLPPSDLQTRLLRRLRADALPSRLLNLIQTACDEAVSAEGLVLSQPERRRLLHSLSAPLWTDLQQRLEE
jgi:hypothetical protein